VLAFNKLTIKVNLSVKHEHKSENTALATKPKNKEPILEMNLILGKIPLTIQKGISVIQQSKAVSSHFESE